MCNAVTGSFGLTNPTLSWVSFFELSLEEKKFQQIYLERVKKKIVSNLHL